MRCRGWSCPERRLRAPASVGNEPHGARDGERDRGEADQDNPSLHATEGFERILIGLQQHGRHRRIALKDDFAGGDAPPPTSMCTVASVRPPCARQWLSRSTAPARYAASSRAPDPPRAAPRRPVGLADRACERTVHRHGGDDVSEHRAARFRFRGCGVVRPPGERHDRHRVRRIQQRRQRCLLRRDRGLVGARERLAGGVERQQDPRAGLRCWYASR